MDSPSNRAIHSQSAVHCSLPSHATNDTYKTCPMQHLMHKIFWKGCQMGRCVKPVKGVKGASLHNKRMMVSALSRCEGCEWWFKFRELVGIFRSIRGRSVNNTNDTVRGMHSFPWKIAFFWTVNSVGEPCLLGWRTVLTRFGRRLYSIKVQRILCKDATSIV